MNEKNSTVCLDRYVSIQSPADISNINAFFYFKETARRNWYEWNSNGTITDAINNVISNDILEYRIDID